MSGWMFLSISLQIHKRHKLVCWFSLVWVAAPQEHVEGKLLRNDQVQIAFIVKMCNGTHAYPVTSRDQRSKR